MVGGRPCLRASGGVEPPLRRSPLGPARGEQPRIDVTSPGRRGTTSARIRHHRVRHLPPADTTKLDQIPVTTVARTLFDLAEVSDRSALERAFEAAERRELLDMEAVRLTCRRNPGRRAHRQLRSLLPSLSRVEPIRSELERLFHRVCRLSNLPRPQVNARVGRFEVDAFWPDAGLVVEVDGWEFHRTRAAFERDRARDAALIVAGYRVIRITWRQVRDDPAGVASTIRRLLAAAI